MKKNKQKKGLKAMPTYQKILIALLTALLMANVYVLFSRTVITSEPEISEPTSSTPEQAEETSKQLEAQEEGLDGP